MVDGMKVNWLTKGKTVDQ